MIYQKQKFEFKSVFAPHIRSYIRLKETVCTNFQAQSGILRQFDRYCIEKGITIIALSENLVNDWIATKYGEKRATYSSRISTLKGFSDYLRSAGYEVNWFPYPGYAGSAQKYVPYIYTEDDISSIISVANNLPKPRGASMFHLIFPTVIKVLYCCGLRVSEVLSLRVKDVDLENGFISIEKAKFENCRKLPVSDSLLTELKSYYFAYRQLIGIDSNGFFFPNPEGEQYSQRSVYDKFRTVLWKSGIPHQGKGKGPRVHDLRHTFSVRSLQKNILSEKDIYVFLPVLMTYLGHSKITSTEYYLRLTAEMFPDFLERADTVCAAIIPEVSSYED